MGLSRLVYAMDRIYVLPSGHGQYIREQSRLESSFPSPSLCRLYFAKVLVPPDTRRTTMVNSANSAKVD